MAGRKQPSTSLRYLKARMQPARNPLFLASVGVITLSGIFLYQYWKNPSILSPIDNTFNSDSIGEPQELDASNAPLDGNESSTLNGPSEQVLQSEGLTGLSPEIPPSQNFQNGVPTLLDSTSPQADQPVADSANPDGSFDYLTGREESLLEQASLDNYSSLFQQNLQKNRRQGGSSLVPTNPNREQVQSLPRDTSVERSTAQQTNPLQQAVDQAFQNNQPSPATAPTESVPNVNRYPDPFARDTSGESNNQRGNRNSNPNAQRSPAGQNQGQSRNFNNERTQDAPEIYVDGPSFFAD